MSPQRLSEKYTLIVTEKPDAATRIAIALDAMGNPKRLVANGVPCYEAQRDKKIVVVPALGHLYTVAAPKTARGFPALDYHWVPRYRTERKANRIKVWLQTISKLAENADEFIDACDFDIEGSIIGYCILKYACGGKDLEAKRMKYSTLTREDLEVSYEATLPHLDFGLINAGLARHEIDWLYGINLSRALTSAAKKASGSYATLSTGRVQGPTLRFLAARERSIARFVPAPYWTVSAKLKMGSHILEVQHEKRTFQIRAEAEAVVQACEGKNGVIVSVEKTIFQHLPPPPFDLGDLQAEAYRLFGYTPMRTSSIAQRLYLDALISYPRTGSQKLPASIDYEKILRNIAKLPEFAALAGELLAKSMLKPAEGKKYDLAHPAIYPTGRLPPKTLTGLERNVYGLVVRRFLAVFADPAVKEPVKAVVDIADEKFMLSVCQILKQGWLSFYSCSARRQEPPFPNFAEGEAVRVQKVFVQEDSTKPPARFNPASVMRKMEQGNIGTKATRAGILQTLYDRGYIREEHIIVTELGLQVTDVLRRFCPTVVSVDFTRRLEEKMALMQQGMVTKAEVLAGAVEALRLIAMSLKENEKAIGEQLGRAVAQAKLEWRTVGKCPTCQTGRLIIQYSKKSGKRFVGCTNYFEGTCKTAFPLPQRGYVKPSGKSCKNCGLGTVEVWLKGKRPLSLCINKDCSFLKRKRPPFQ